MGRRSIPAARWRFLHGYPGNAVYWVQIGTADLTCARSKFASGAFIYPILSSIRGPPLFIPPCTTLPERKANMKKINLKDYYPFYQGDCFIDVPDELADLLGHYEAKEATHSRKLRFHQACFSLDRNDGIDRKIIYVSRSPEEIYERKLTREQLHAAMETLTDKQAKRIYAHFFLGLSKADIARNEGVGRDLITRSIQQGLSRIRQYLKKSDPP